MAHRTRSACRLLGCLVVVLAPAAGAGAADDVYYTYFKQAIPLSLDGERVALFPAPGWSAAMHAQAVGLPTETIEPLPLGEAYLAPVSAGARSVGELRGRVADLAADAATAFVSPLLRDAQGEPVVITRDVLVGVDPALTPGEAAALLETLGGLDDVAAPWPSLPNAWRIRCAARDGFAVLDLANALARDSRIVFAEPDMLATARSTEIPNDPDYGAQWALYNTGQSGGAAGMDLQGPQSREYAAGAGVVVAVLDNGMQLDHPDLGPVTGADLTGNGTAGAPGNVCDNHATLIGGTIRALENNGVGIAGAAPACALRSVRYGISTVPCNGNGSYQTSWLVDALAWCQNNGVRVTVNSNTLNPQSAVTSKYQETWNAGMIHFASSGNSFSPLVAYPANLATVVAVGAVDRTGARATFSNYGSGLALVAPGVEILTTDRSGADGQDAGDYDTVDGTSFAAPYAAAVAALVLGVDPALTPAQVEDILRSSARDLGPAGYDIQYGAGLVQAQAAVVSAGARLPASTLAACLNGPQTPTPPAGCSAMQFDLADEDGDGDVDLADFSRYAR